MSESCLQASVVPLWSHPAMQEVTRGDLTNNAKSAQSHPASVQSKQKSNVPTTEQPHQQELVRRVADLVKQAKAQALDSVALWILRLQSPSCFHPALPCKIKLDMSVHGSWLVACPACPPPPAALHLGDGMSSLRTCPRRSRYCRFCPSQACLHPL